MTGCGKCGKWNANPLILLREVCCGKCGKLPAKSLIFLRWVCGKCVPYYYVIGSGPLGAGPDLSHEVTR